MKAAFIAALCVAASAPTVALADDLRPFCADRPGLGTPPCIVDDGHLIVETGIADWTREDDPDARTDTLSGGDLLLRYGLDTMTEAQIGWTAFGHVRSRDKATGAVERMTGTGDVTLAVRRSLSHPDGDGFSAAVMPYATLPVGGRAIGAGTVTAGLLVPVSYSLTGGVQLALTPSVEASADEDRHGRHLSYGTVVSVEMDLADAVSATVEYQATRDRDPSGHATQSLAAIALAVQPSDAVQLDLGAVMGLNHARADVEIYAGIARRF
ncbi:MAG: transporter [Sphingobium sp.]|nr:MAG: transporter [Sphingobium sp.]